MGPVSGSILRGLVAGSAVLVLASAAVGIAAAQTTPPGQAASGYAKFVDALAKRLNITPAQLETVISEARTEAGLPPDRGIPGASHSPGGAGGRGLHVDLNAAATAIGIPARQLRTELSGKSLAQVATDHGKTAYDVGTALKNAAHTRIDQAVTSGKLPADQANGQKTSADQRIDRMVTQVLPQRPTKNKQGSPPAASEGQWD